MINGQRHLILILLANIVLTLPLKGFGPLAHYKASPDVSAQWQQNLPDLWKSWECRPSLAPSGIPSFNFEVVEYFAWSHACQKKGQLPPVSFTIPVIDLPVAVTCPEEPTQYNQPPGVETPEGDMWYLCQHKLLPEHVTNMMKKTARGFACHNAEDRIVHFTYFKAGSGWNWIVEHWLKETWAEYDIFLAIGGTYDPLGYPIVPSGMNMGATGDPSIINLAQKVFRKNRQNCSYDGYPPSKINVKTAAEMSSLISDQNDKLTSYLWTFSSTMKDQYDLIAQLPATPSTPPTPATNWMQGDGWSKCIEARAAAVTAYTAMP